QWAHAEAPAAKILLVEAVSSSFADLFSAVQQAASMGATQVSMSWGGAEYKTESRQDSVFSHSGTTYVAASGDFGAPPQYPATSPNVIAIGGTSLSGCGGTSCAGLTVATASPAS